MERFCKWNFKHIVNIKTIRGVRAITNLEGYKGYDTSGKMDFYNEGGKAFLREMEESFRKHDSHKHQRKKLSF